MNLDNLSTVCNQIDNLLKNLTKQNVKSTNQEINSLIDNQGTEILSYLLKRLFNETCNLINKDGSNINHVISNSIEFPVISLLSSRIANLLQRADFINLLASTYPDYDRDEDKENNSGSKQQQGSVIAHLDFLSKVLSISNFQKVLFGIYGWKNSESGFFTNEKNG